MLKKTVAENTPLDMSWQLYKFAPPIQIQTQKMSAWGLIIVRLQHLFFHYYANRQRALLLLFLEAKQSSNTCLPSRTLARNSFSEALRITPLRNFPVIFTEILFLDF